LEALLHIEGITAGNGVAIGTVGCNSVTMQVVLSFVLAAGLFEDVVLSFVLAAGVFEGVVLSFVLAAGLFEGVVLSFVLAAGLFEDATKSTVANAVSLAVSLKHNNY